MVRAVGDEGRFEGEHSPGLFLVLAGELVVQKEDPAGGVVSLGILREGDIAGEISLLTGLRATATVVATRKTDHIVVGVIRPTAPQLSPAGTP